MTKIFKEIMEIPFRKTTDGKDIFYPLGIFMYGRIIPDESEKRKLQKCIKIYYPLGFLMISFVFLLNLYCLLTFACLVVVYYLHVSRITSGYEISSIKYTALPEEAEEEPRNKKLVFWGSVLGVILIIVGLLLIYLDKDVSIAILIAMVGLFILLHLQKTSLGPD